MSGNTGIKYISPGSINFFSFGIENLAMAIDNPSNEIVARTNREINNCSIELFTGDRNNNSGFKSRIKSICDQFLKNNNCSQGIILEIYNKIPADQSLGNLEANIVASVLAINELEAVHLDKNKIFNQICEISDELNIEINPVSVATSLFGGIISYNKNTIKRIEKIFCPKGIFISIFKSEIFDVDKEDQAVIISKEISADTVSIINSLQISDMDIFLQTLQNNNFQKALNRTIPYFDDIRKTSIASGAFGSGFSKSGGSVIIFYPNTLIKDETNHQLHEILETNKVRFQRFDAIINLNGAYKA